MTNKEMSITTPILFVDCFGTVILRKYPPNNVIKKWIDVLAVKYNFNSKNAYKIFNKIKVKSTMKFFFQKFSFEPSMEIVLKKFTESLYILNYISNKNDFLKTAFDEYINTEINYQYPNENIVNIIKKCKEQNKRIFLVSDFYCAKDVLIKWLTSLGLATLFDEVISSCDYEKDKATGRLYKTLLKSYNIKRKDVTMIGDNCWSDFFVAKLCGIKSIKIKRTKYEKR